MIQCCSSHLRNISQIRLFLLSKTLNCFFILSPKVSWTVIIPCSGISKKNNYSAASDQLQLCCQNTDTSKHEDIISTMPSLHWLHFAFKTDFAIYYLQSPERPLLNYIFYCPMSPPLPCDPGMSHSSVTITDHPGTDSWAV